MSEPPVVDVVPWLPGRLGRWVTAPIPAERLAALRIAVAVVFLVDLLGFYLPEFALLLGPRSVTAAALRGSETPGGWQWSVLWWLPPEWGGAAVLGVGVLAGFALLVGWKPQLAAAIAWAVAVSLHHANWPLHNGGDRIRPLLLLILALSPCGAVWSVSPVAAARVLVSGWPAAVLLVQMMCIYYFSGMSKFQNPEWRTGTVLVGHGTDPFWCTFPHLYSATPMWIFKLAAWTTLAWEILFPVLMIVRPVRYVALAIGVMFHLGTALFFDIGLFPFYSMCCYIPLLPIERLIRTTHG